MQGFWILLLAVYTMYSSAADTFLPKTYRVELSYGHQLSIQLPTVSEKLEFISANASQTDVLWSRSSITKRGIITGRDEGRKFVIHSVTFDDQGTYNLFDYWNKKISIHLLKVFTQRESQNRVAGETLKISLGDLSKNDATLHFSNEDYNLTLVKRGSPVGNLNPEYMGRIQVTSSSIEVLNVNVSDVGNYTLSDRLNRKIKIISMHLVDHHVGVNAGPFMGLLMLLGIPPCIFCCCRKKVCRKSSQPTTTAVNTTTVMYDNQIHPPGPPPTYTNPAAPAGPTPGYTPGYPAGTVPPPNPTFPPQPPYGGYPATSPAMPPNPAFNPAYPPASDLPPAQPPQWSGAPYNQPTPAGFAPVMYNAPAGPDPVKGEITATTPLLTPPQPEVVQPPVPYTGPNDHNSLNSAVQFNMNMGKDSSSNFL